MEYKNKQEIFKYLSNRYRIGHLCVVEVVTLNLDSLRVNKFVRVYIPFIIYTCYLKIVHKQWRVH